MRTAPFAACVIATLVACGGSVQPERVSEDAATRPTPADSGTSSRSGGDADASQNADAAQPEAGEGAPADAGTLPFGPECPAVPPGNGGSCMPVNWLCEYGDAANAYCDSLEICYGDLGGWSDQSLAVASCGKGTCPPSYAEVVQGQACPAQNLDCAYPEGQCDCGQKGHSGPPVWSCFSPAGCPQPRPRFGSACAQDGLYCDYGACAGGAAEQCVLQLGWRQEVPTCP
jgi:hypothetical protein